MSITSSLVPSARRYFSLNVWGIVVWPFRVTTTVVNFAHTEERRGSNKNCGTTKNAVLLRPCQVIRGAATSTLNDPVLTGNLGSSHLGSGFSASSTLPEMVLSRPNEAANYFISGAEP